MELMLLNPQTRSRCTDSCDEPIFDALQLYFQTLLESLIVMTKARQCPRFAPHGAHLPNDEMARPAQIWDRREFVDMLLPCLAT